MTDIYMFPRMLPDVTMMEWILKHTTNENRSTKKPHKYAMTNNEYSQKDKTALKNDTANNNKKNSNLEIGVNLRKEDGNTRPRNLDY